jgi:glycosyltransferase EpsF
MQIRVLHIVGQLGFGGITTWLKTLVLNAPRSELAIDICCNFRKSPGELVQEFKDLGCIVYHIPLHWNLITYIDSLMVILKNGGYHIVHDHRGIICGASLKAAFKARIPVRIMYHHTPDDELVRGFFRDMYVSFLRKWAYRYATNIWGCAQTVMVGHYGSEWRKKDSRFDVLYGAVDIKKPSERARKCIRKELDLDEGIKLIGFIGRVNYQKNVVVAMKTCLEIMQRRTDLRVIWVGEGPYLDQVKNMAQSSDFSRCFYFFNFRKDIPDILQAIDVLFMPSNFEGLSLLVLEALHSGVPIVGSRTPGILEALPQSRHSLCAEPSDIDAHIRNILLAFHNKGKMAADKDFLELFSPENFHKRMVSSYSMAIKQFDKSVEKPITRVLQ